MGESTAQKRSRNDDDDDDNSFDFNGQTTSFHARPDSYVPSNTVLPSLNSMDTPVYNDYQPALTNATNAGGPMDQNNMFGGNGIEQTHYSLSQANGYETKQGVVGYNIGAVDYQHNFAPHHFSSGHPQQSRAQNPSGYAQSSGYASITHNPQLWANGEIDSSVTTQKVRDQHSRQVIPGCSQSRNGSTAFTIPPVQGIYRQGTIGQSLSNCATPAQCPLALDSFNEYNTFSTFAASPIQQLPQNSGWKALESQQRRHNAPPNEGLPSGFASSTQKQDLQPNQCFKFQIPHTQLPDAQGTQQPVISSAPVQQDGYRWQQSAKVTPNSGKKSTSTDFDPILKKQLTAACEVIDLTNNDPFPTPAPALEGTNAPKKDNKLFDKYVSPFSEIGHPVQRQLHDHEQGKGVDRPAKYSLAEKELAIGQNSKYEWERDLAIEERQELGLPEGKTEAQVKREKNAEQRRKCKEKKRAKENAQNASATLTAPAAPTTPAVMPNLGTAAPIQTAPTQTAPTQIGPALTKGALKALGPLTLARSKRLWHTVEHGYMWWEPNQEDYNDLIRPGGLGDPMYKCAHEEPKCEVAPITCTHSCCQTGVPWKTKKDLLVKTARKIGDKEAEKRGFPRPKYTRGAREPEAPPMQSSATPAPTTVSAQLTSSQAVVSMQNPGLIPVLGPKPAVLSSGQLAFLRATNPSLFASLQAQQQPHSQATENRSRKPQRELDEPSAAPRSKRTSGWTAQDQTPEPAIVVPYQRPASVPGWANQDCQPELLTNALPKKLISVPEPPKGAGGSGWVNQDREPQPAPAVPFPMPASKPITQGVAIASVGATDPSDEEDDGEMDSLFGDDGLGSLFGDDDFDT